MGLRLWKRGYHDVSNIRTTRGICKPRKINAAGVGNESGLSILCACFQSTFGTLPRSISVLVNLYSPGKAEKKIGGWVYQVPFKTNVVGRRHFLFYGTKKGKIVCSKMSSMTIKITMSTVAVNVNSITMSS